MKWIDQHWMTDAACRDKDRALFFPAAGASPALTERAKAICDGCPVLIQCREYAMSLPDLLGTWGGMTASDRHFARRRRARRTAA